MSLLIATLVVLTGLAGSKSVYKLDDDFIDMWSNLKHIEDLDVDNFLNADDFATYNGSSDLVVS